MGALVLCATGVITGCTGVVASTEGRDTDDGEERPPNTGGRGGGGQGGAGGQAAWDPGRVTLRRLNRVEYNNTVRDLLGTSLRPADAFPPDDRGFGFDNLADALTLSPVHLSLYVASAEQLVNEALSQPVQRIRLLSCSTTDANAEACVGKTVRAFARRAWRRPPTDAEIARLVKTAAIGPAQAQTWEQGLALALQAVLVSPHFIFRIELDGDPSSLQSHKLTDHELATRLAYLLWSSMPDNELFALADRGELGRKEELTRQTLRMLADPKGTAFAENFGGQWLYLRKMVEVKPDPAEFPSFDESLRRAMYEESRLLFADVVAGREPVSALLNAKFTYLNDRLARHYGLPAVGSDKHKRVTLPSDGPRAGFLGQGAFLTVTSHTTRTSPVLRGKWVSTQLLCQEVPPPPPNVNVDLTDASDAADKSLRERLSAHAVGACAGCHKLMDTIGFGLENFDGIGAYRTKDGKFNVDAKGALPDGEPFTGARELGDLVARDKQFASCLAQNAYIYALGRVSSDAPEHLDGSILADLAAKLGSSDFGFNDLLVSLTNAPTFSFRRGEGAQQ